MKSTVLNRVLYLKRLLLSLSLLLLTNISAFADQLQIGQYKTFSVSAPQGWIDAATWTCDKEGISMEKQGNGEVCLVYPWRYFQGTATIRCEFYYSYQTYYSGRYHTKTGSGSSTFYVTCAVPTLRINPDKITVQPGEQVHLQAVVTPTASDQYPVVSWSFSDSYLVSYDWNKTKSPFKDIYLDIANNKSGVCVATADIGGGLTASCTITIAGKEPESVSLPSTATVKVGETISLTPTLSPSDAHTTYSWSSDNTSVATVYKDGDVGKVTGKNEGTATITVTTANGKKANCKVTVTPPVGIAINAKNFPDANFRGYLLKQTWGKDAILEDDEIEGIKDLTLDEMNIRDLKGIECFTSLRYLYCSKNQLSSLDVSSNTSLVILTCGDNQLSSLDVSRNTALLLLTCGDNQLSSLDVSRNTALASLFCNNNQLSSLDVSRNTSLETLYCHNNQLSSFNVSKNISLETLYCYDNQLSSLDVSKNTALTSLRCERNQLSSLNVLGNPALTFLSCSNNQLSSLDVSRNTALNYLYCYDNQLSTLDVSKNTALKYLECDNNQLSSLDVSSNTVLTSLSCYNNRLSSLNVSSNTALTSVNCSGNQLSSLNVSRNTELTSLSCNDNHLSSLDVSRNTGLESLYCSNNQLSSLDVSRNTGLKTLYCSNNRLPSLDVSRNTGLKSLHCDNDQLSSLDVSRNKELTWLYCAVNKIIGIAMDNLVNSLPQKMSEDAVFAVFNNTDGNEGNVCTKAQVATAKAKGWTPQYYNGTKWLEYEGSDETGIEGVMNGDLKVYTIYNLAGQHLATPMKGINIINGRKVFVK